jgi:hypothetical protein
VEAVAVAADFAAEDAESFSVSPWAPVEADPDEALTPPSEEVTSAAVSLESAARSLVDVEVVVV